MNRSPLLNDDEIRQLKLFGWFLLFVNLCIAGIGLLFAPLFIAVDTLNTIPHFRDAYSVAGPVTVGVMVLVNSAFVLIVAGNILLVLLSSFLSSRGSHGTQGVILSQL